MKQFIKKLCHKLCHNLFDKSSTQCSEQALSEDRSRLFTPLSTEQKVKINRKINHFCQINKNRFWIIYYRLTEQKIDFLCKRCSKFEGCQAYILKRIVKHIKVFNSDQESTIFQEVRQRVLNQKRTDSLFNKKEQEIISFYQKKIKSDYQERAFDLQTGVALVENILASLNNQELSSHIQTRLKRYRLYQSPIVLEGIFTEQRDENVKLKETSFLELLTMEKFINYIKQPLESRYIDFLRSSEFIKEVSTEVEESSHKSSSNHSTDVYLVDRLLKSLSRSERILYKLRYGIALDNQEFLVVSEQFKETKEGISEIFNTTEKLYIKFLLHYNLDENSEHFTIFHNREEIQASISKKLLKYRENLSTHSYNNQEFEETLLRLIYGEPLKAKEVGKLLGFSDREIYKKVESIKKKLKRLEARL